MPLDNAWNIFHKTELSVIISQSGSTLLIVNVCIVKDKTRTWHVAVHETMVLYKTMVMCDVWKKYNHTCCHYRIYFTTLFFFFTLQCFRSRYRIGGVLNIRCVQLSTVVFTFQNQSPPCENRTVSVVFFVLFCFQLRLTMWLMMKPTSEHTATSKKRKVNRSFLFAACNDNNTIKFCVQSEMLKYMNM